MPTQSSSRLGLSAPQIKKTLEVGFEFNLKGKTCYKSFDDLLNTFNLRHGTLLNFDTLPNCKASLELLTIFLPSYGSVGNNQFWKLACCLLHEAGGKGVEEPGRIKATLGFWEHEDIDWDRLSL